MKKIFYTCYKIDPIENETITDSSKVIFKKYYIVFGILVYKSIKVISKKELYRWLSNRNK